MSESIKNIGGLTIDVSIEGYDKAKQQLRKLEATFDRILEKQERVSKIVNSNDHELLLRIDSDCSKIVGRIDELSEYIRIKGMFISGR